VQIFILEDIFIHKLFIRIRTGETDEAAL